MQSQKITKTTKIFAIGHLLGHIDLKVKLLKEAGFENTIGLIASETPMEQLKQLLLDSPNSLFLVGGAMYKGYPEYMSEINQYLISQCPTVIVHNVSLADFPEGTVPPVSEQVVAQAAVKVCLSKL